MEEEVICQSSNGELLVFYVDENGSQEEAIVTSIESIEQGNLDELQNSYLLGNTEMEPSEDPTQPEDTTVVWQDEEIKRLLIFYIDNKKTFQSGTTNRKHLWTVACKTMLTGKTPDLCDVTLQSLKNNYLKIIKGSKDRQSQRPELTWIYYNLCHQAFHDECHNGDQQSEEEATENVTYTVETYNTLKTKQIDESVLRMLTSYLNFKKRNPSLSGMKNFWENTAMELGNTEDYWNKRFLNYKQHYIRMLDKRKLEGPDSISWPYMAIYDEIYRDDVNFQKKYGGEVKEIPEPEPQQIPVRVREWNSAEKTVLVKYCFDCFDDFRDPKIPGSFLWNEVGRLLDRPPAMCKQKYEMLKNEHLDQYIEGGYDIENRIPIAILFDNIFYKELEHLLAKGPSRYQAEMEIWKTEELDELVQFFYNNTELFKDPICHFVCWAAIGKKLHRNIHSLLNQWRDLTALYKSILDDKKENSDMEIDWRYIDMFDRIFDFGMDTKLLNGYEKLLEVGDKNTGNIPVKKVNIHLEEDLPENDMESDDEDYDEKGTAKRSRGIGDKKQLQILEYYFKNKEKFATSQRKKLWQVLADQIGISAEQCAHRFRNLKQVYTAYVQREIEKPEMPILWPYYVMCKKVFGYRLLKNKLRNAMYDKLDVEEWSPKEIKSLIRYFGRNYSVINENSDDISLWASLSREIGKTEVACRDKFLDLRKSYRKVKTMMNRNPNCKVNWKYYKLFDEYGEPSTEQMEVDDGEFSMYVTEELVVPELQQNNTDGTETDGTAQEEDYCIIVLPEGQELKDTDVAAAKIVIKPTESPVKSTPESKDEKIFALWKEHTKKQLLVTYLNYITAHRGKTIDSGQMWNDIAKKFPNKKALFCKRVFDALMRKHKKKSSDSDEEYKKSHYYELFEKILDVDAKFSSPASSLDLIELDEKDSYSDVSLPSGKVEQALKYYLDHIEEFNSPIYVKKFIWNELANHSLTNITKIFNKINFLKQNYANSSEGNREKLEFAPILKQIYEKEILLKIALENEPKPMSVDEELESLWTDEETEKLLHWYLVNLEKFKNPKYVTSYLWMEAPIVLNKSALACSKKMSEIRTQYSNMVKENSEALQIWRFQELCQKIYGTGKKSVNNGD